MRKKCKEDNKRLWCNSVDNWRISSMNHSFQVMSVHYSSLKTLLLCIMDASGAPQDASLPFKLISGFLSPSWCLACHLLCHFREAEEWASLMGDKRRHCSNLSQKTSSNTKRGLLADIQRASIFEATWARCGGKVRLVSSPHTRFELLCDVSLWSNRGKQKPGQRAQMQNTDTNDSLGKRFRLLERRHCW